MRLKNILRQLINRCGYDVRRLAYGATNTRTSISESYSLLSELGFKPETVIDVGVATGTMELYKHFPYAYFLLIEPLRDFEKDLISIVESRKGSYVLAAAGSSKSSVVFNVHNKYLEGSSLYKESMGIEADGDEITIPMVIIDDVIQKKQLVGPYLLKIDVQGAELDVLDGAKQTLVEAEVVVLEVSLFEFMKGAPQFSDVVSYMKSRGFVAYDIVLGWNRPLDNALGQVDIVFVQDCSMFRGNHSFATAEQLNVH